MENRTMKKLNIVREHEVYKNGLLIDTIEGDDPYYEYLDKLRHSFCKEGYRIIREGYGDIVFYHDSMHMSFVIHSRTYTGFNDCNGKKIYTYNELKNKNGEYVYIGEKSFEDGEYYYRVSYGNHRWHDTDITDLKFIKEEGVHIV